METFTCHHVKHDVLFLVFLFEQKTFIIIHVRKRAISPLRKESCSVLPFWKAMLLVDGKWGRATLRAREINSWCLQSMLNIVLHKAHIRMPAQVNQRYLIAFLWILREPFLVFVILCSQKHPPALRFHFYKFSGKAKGCDMLTAILVNFKGSQQPMVVPPALASQRPRMKLALVKCAPNESHIL